MTHFAPKFEVTSGDDKYRCNEWASSHRYLGLSVDELKVEKRFRNK